MALRRFGMNGLEGPYSQILINSRPVFSGLAGVYGLELIPANMIERVEVIRGGGSSMYGSNAIAGTINLITKDPVANNFEGAFSNSAIGIGLDGEAANDYNVNLNGSYVTDDYRTGMSIFGFHRKRDGFDATGDGFTELAKIKNLLLWAGGCTSALPIVQSLRLITLISTNSAEEETGLICPCTKLMLPKVLPTGLIRGR